MLFDKDTVKANTLSVLEKEWTEYVEMLNEEEHFRTMIEKFEKIIEHQNEFVFWQMHMCENADFILHSNNNLYGIRAVTQYMSDRWMDFDDDTELQLVKFEQRHADHQELSTMEFKLFSICDFGDESRQCVAKEYVRMYDVPPTHEIVAKFCRLDWDKYFKLLDLIAETEGEDVYDIIKLDEMIEKEFEFK